MHGRSTWAVATAAGVCLLVGACQNAPKERREPTPLDLSTVGSISGVVRFEGTPPAQAELQVGSTAECAAQHAGKVYAGDVLVRDGKVQNAVVFLKEGLGDRAFAVPDAPVVIDQEGCLFVPRIAAAQVGQPVRFLNSDPVAHNVHAVAPGSSGWNFMLGLKGASRETTVDEPELPIELKCDVHPWMKAYLAVFDHPYFAVTGADGRFALDRVPPGDYVVEAWHERFGTRTARVSLAPKASETLTFTFAAP
jgi:plastocyanin